jgi:hypothetical protein
VSEVFSPGVVRDSWLLSHRNYLRKTIHEWNGDGNLQNSVHWQTLVFALLNFLSCGTRLMGSYNRGSVLGKEVAKEQCG